MRQLSRFRALITATAGILAVAAGTAGSAGAAGIAYLDGKEVWVSNLDGTAKVRLSGGEGDWTAVAQSDQGFVVGVRLEAGKIADLSSFTIWNPDGTQKDFGPLAGKTNGGSNAYPLGLDITPDGGLLVYGYSNYITFGNILTNGTFLLPSATRSAPVGGPYSVNSVRWTTLVGDRIIGTSDELQTSVQEVGSTGSQNFTPWITIAGEPGAPELHRTDVAATGTIAALEYAYYGAEVSTIDEKVLVIRAQSVGGTVIDAGQCFLDGVRATYPSFSQDAQTLAWSDAAGVKIGGVPTFTGPDGGVCTLTRAPVTISATGKWPSYGPINVEGILAARNPAPAPTPTPAPTAAPTPPSATTPPTVSAPAKLKATKLGAKAGATIDVTTTSAGEAVATLTVRPKSIGKKGKKPVVIATGKATLKADGAKAQPVKLKATKSGKKLLGKLKGKKVTITVVLNGRSTSIDVTLR